MPATKYDFNIEQGTSFRLSLIYKDNNGSVINLTGYCARLIIKSNNNEYKTFTTLNNNYSEYKFTIDEAQGAITLWLPANTTNGYNFTSAKYDLEVQSPQDIYNGGGKQTSRILYGTITIVKRFSRSDTPLDCAT